MFLIFGGTTEGKMVASFLNEKGLPFIYSTKTEIEFNVKKNHEYRWGAFSEDELVEFIKLKRIRTIIHASHPFAELLTETIKKASERTYVKVIRFKRESTKRYSDAFYVSGYEDAIIKLRELGVERLLAFTGVQTIEKLKPFWQANHTFFRILDRPSSIALAETHGFPKNRLILGYPSKTVDDECRLMINTQCDGVITKQSGTVGGEDIKYHATKRCQIPIIIIERPVLPESFIVVDSLEQLLVELHKMEAFWN